MRAALERRVEEPDYRVIPVLLPGAPWIGRSNLPSFLRIFRWVDFRAGLDEAQALHELLSGIKGVAPGPEPAEVECPFRGLQPFDQEHAKFFCGREALVQDLVERLRTHRFLAISGPSGVGKSSLVRAGIVPAIRQGQIEGSERWPVVVLKPGPSPLEMLAARLLPDSVQEVDKPSLSDKYQSRLRESETGLNWITQVRLSGRPDSCRLLLVVDQFEETFSLCKDPKTRARFIDNLVYASEVDGGQTVVVLTMRADFGEQLAEYPALTDRLSGRQEVLSRLQGRELRWAITEPARRAGLRYEKGLVDTILEDLRGAAGRLPLLQHTLWMLCQEGRRGRWMAIDRYEQIGRVRGALTRHAESVYDMLTQEQRQEARRILLRLAQPGAPAHTARRAPRDELGLDEPGRECAAQTVRDLTDARLLTTDRDEHDQEVVQVAHEALIHYWPRLRTWIEESQLQMQVQRRLTEAANEWDKAGRPAGLLYVGDRLSQAGAVLPAEDQSPLERAFLAQSRRAKRKAEEAARAAKAAVLAAEEEARSARKAAQTARKGRRVSRSAAIAIAVIGVGLLILLALLLRTPWERIFGDDEAWALAVTNEAQPTYFIGTKDSGLRSSQDGKEWVQHTRGLPTVGGPEGRNLPAVERLAVDGHSPEVVYAFLSEHGVFRSTDGGKGWSIAGSGVLTTSDVIDIAAWDSLVLAVSDMPDGHSLYVSHDAGQGWDRVGGRGDPLFDKVYTVHLDGGGETVYVGARTGFYSLPIRERVTADAPWSKIDERTVIHVASTGLEDEVFYLAALHGAGKDAQQVDSLGGLYRWRPGEPALTLLTQITEVPIALAPHSDASASDQLYVLFADREVKALDRDNVLRSMGSEPPGVSLALLLGLEPKQQRPWLLLGGQRGLYAYKDKLN
jgi:hypothetical protein